MISFIQQLKKKSSYPVKETTKQGPHFTGWFIHNFSLISSDGKIEINKKMSTSEKEGTLSHEIGHTRCWERKCRCYTNNNRVLQEVHAELHALHLLLRNQRKHAIIPRFRRWKQNWDDDSDDVYCRVLPIIKKRRIYKRCQNFVNEG